MYSHRVSINKNTIKLRKALKRLGYEPLVPDVVKGGYLTTLRTGCFVPIINDDYLAKGSNYIYCGINEDLFLAIAALRDDSDIDQWFCDNKGNFFLCKYDNVDEHIEKEMSNCKRIKVHKASVKELIKEFKTEIL